MWPAQTYLKGYEEAASTYGYWPSFQDSPLIGFDDQGDSIEIEVRACGDLKLTFITAGQHRAGLVKKVLPYEGTQLRRLIDSVRWDKIVYCEISGMNFTLVNVAAGRRERRIRDPEEEPRMRGATTHNKVVAESFRLAGLEPDGQPQFKNSPSKTENSFTRSSY